MTRPKRVYDWYRNYKLPHTYIYTEETPKKTRTMTVIDWRLSGAVSIIAHNGRQIYLQDWRMEPFWKRASDLWEHSHKISYCEAICRAAHEFMDKFVEELINPTI